MYSTKIIGADGTSILAVTAGGSFPASPDIPLGATPVTASSGNVTNAVATATLPAAVGKTTYITGFSCTGSGATAALVVILTIVGVITGTLHYIYAAVAGAALINTPIHVTFPKPIPANALNTAITVSCPALGLGNTNNAVVAHGYQL